MLNLITKLKKKNKATFIVTDSGLGGLSIAADLFERLQKMYLFESSRVVFFNSSFDNFSGYNKINSHAEKIRIFNSALNSMANMYNPDVIIIGCNTLSVIYPETPFFNITTIPVIEIVGIGVNSILSKISESNPYHICIFATPTTVSSTIYSKNLISRGIHENSISEISCGTLADEIEYDFTSKKTREMVVNCVKQACSRIQDKSYHIIVSLNCTHYGYIADIFRESFADLGYNHVSIVNPNPDMIDYLFDQKTPSERIDTDVQIEVVSKVSIFPNVMSSIGNLLMNISPETVRAMREYKKNMYLF